MFPLGVHIPLRRPCACGSQLAITGLHSDRSQGALQALSRASAPHSRSPGSSQGAHTVQPALCTSGAAGAVAQGQILGALHGCPGARTRTAQAHHGPHSGSRRCRPARGPQRGTAQPQPQRWWLAALGGDLDVLQHGAGDGACSWVPGLRRPALSASAPCTAACSTWRCTWTTCTRAVGLVRRPARRPQRPAAPHQRAVGSGAGPGAGAAARSAVHVAVAQAAVARQQQGHGGVVHRVAAAAAQGARQRTQPRAARSARSVASYARILSAVIVGVVMVSSCVVWCGVELRIWQRS